MLLEGLWFCPRIAGRESPSCAPTSKKPEMLPPPTEVGQTTHPQTTSEKTMNTRTHSLIFSITILSLATAMTLSIPLSVYTRPVDPLADIGRASGFAAPIHTLTVSTNYIWHTFYGSSNWDTGYSIAVDASNNIYMTGYSEATWGNPLHPHSG